MLPTGCRRHACLSHIEIHSTTDGLTRSTLVVEYPIQHCSALPAWRLVSFDGVHKFTTGINPPLARPDPNPAPRPRAAGSSSRITYLKNNAFGEFLSSVVVVVVVGRFDRSCDGSRSHSSFVSLYRPCCCLMAPPLPPSSRSQNDGHIYRQRFPITLMSSPLHDFYSFIPQYSSSHSNIFSSACNSSPFSLFAFRRLA